MKKYEVEIKGIQPVIWNVLRRELELEKKELKKDQLSEWEEDPKNWKRKAEFNDKGEVVIPERWFKGALIGSCKKNRIVPHFATRKNETYTSYVQSFMVFNGHKLCGKDDLVEFGVFVSPQGMSNRNTKIWRVRPMLKKWSATFILIDPAGRIKMAELKEIIEYAGLMIGLGDNRINNYGRFELKKIMEVA